MSEVLGMRIRHGMKHQKYWTCKSDIYETSLVLGMRTTREIFFKGTGHACVSDMPIRGTGHAWQMQNKISEIRSINIRHGIKGQQYWVKHITRE